MSKMPIYTPYDLDTQSIRTFDVWTVYFDFLRPFTFQQTVQFLRIFQHLVKPFYLNDRLLSKTRIFSIYRPHWVRVRVPTRVRVGVSTTVRVRVPTRVRDRVPTMVRVRVPTIISHFCENSLTKNDKFLNFFYQNLRLF